MFLRYSVSLLGYGFYGDVLTDSERKRWMGPARYDLSGSDAGPGLENLNCNVKPFVPNLLTYSEQLLESSVRHNHLEGSKRPRRYPGGGWAGLQHPRVTLDGLSLDSQA